MNFVYLHAHLLHYLHTITEREHDALLCCPDEVCTVVLVEVNTTNGTSHLLIFQNTLSTIAKGNHRDAFRTDGHRCGKVVHLGIPYLGRNIAMHPCVQNTGAIYAQQHAKTILPGGIVRMCKGVYSALGVEVHIAQHTIYYS